MPYAWNVAHEKYRAQRELSHCLSARRVAKYAGIRGVGERERPSFLGSLKPVLYDSPQNSPRISIKTSFKKHFIKNILFFLFSFVIRDYISHKHMQ